jgi:hypothetical protein
MKTLWLKVVVESFQKDKSRGPDGWSIDFFLGFYDYIVEDVLKVLEESRVLRKILGAIDSTFIVLIIKNLKG